MRIEKQFSAGGVVYRRTDGDIEVVLCGRERPATWNLPKGTPDPGETPGQTALREVREETGLDVHIVSDLGHIEYWFSKPGARVHKRVQFYLMQATGGSTEAHDPEFDRVTWFPREEALRTLTHPNEAAIVTRAYEHLRQCEPKDAERNRAVTN